MNPVYYVDNKKPLSHNDSGKERYKQYHSERFRDRYASLYSGLPTTDNNLKTELVYIHNVIYKDQLPDVDNLSKPIIDAFSGVIYRDDCQVIERSAKRLKLEDLNVVSIEYSYMPPQVSEDLEDFLQKREKHIVLLTVSNIRLADITIGGIQV